MKQFITRFVKFLALVIAALRSSASHQRQQFYRSAVYHKTWYTLLIHWKWMNIPILGLWEISGDTDWCLPVDSGWEQEGFNTYCAALDEFMEADTYYYVVRTSRGSVPWPMVSGFYR